MKWADFRSCLTGKLQATLLRRTGHDFYAVECDGAVVGRAKVGRHAEMKPWEIRGSAKDLNLSEHDFRELVSCRISREEFCLRAHSSTG